MPSPQLLPSGAYRVRFSIGNGERDSRTFLTEDEALSFCAALRSATQGQSGGTTQRFDAWVAHWWQRHRSGVKPSSASRYKSIINNHLLPQLGAYELIELDRSMIDDWMADEGRSTNNTNSALMILKMILESAYEEGRIAHNPAKGVKRLRDPDASRHIKILPETEVFCLAEAIDPRFRCLVLVAGYCGLRIGELSALQREFLDLDRGRLTVAQTHTRDPERGNIGPPKSRAGFRTVNIPAFLVRELQDHIDSGFTSGEFVFSAPRGGRFTPNAFYDRRWPAAKAAVPGVPSDLKFHELRHTAVSLWIRSGASPTLVKQWGGHSSISYIFDTYGHLFDDEGAALAAKMDEHASSLSSAARQGATTSQSADGPVLL